MVNVRKANEGDLSRAAELSGLWVTEGITYGLGANTEEILRNYIGDYFWVAEIKSVVVGYITGTVHESDGLAVIEKVSVTLRSMRFTFIQIIGATISGMRWLISCSNPLKAMG
ncbi:hypothetical protein [Paenibacillus sacheonensis]|uniref:hypothetical protein n=1 Tax=Paenibacillus sacheonensis TaxID=742054 RepID=UPI001EF98F70|nr:hypothetical protein [Paenibacillus sacheonensis]MBM7568771.1 hypothetical protein [Paenibacillus sacheonensis]